MLKTSIRQKVTTAYNLISNRLTSTLNIWVPTIVNFLLKKIVRKTEINPLLLFTENRKDIDYRLSFLKEVLIKKINPKNTTYYAFTLELEPSGYPDLICKRFIETHKSIKKNGIKKPVYIIKNNNKSIKTTHLYNSKKHQREYKNKTKYQIFDGAHRVAIAIFLGYKTIPCKIFKPVSFEIPDYTGYIKKKERLYKSLINNSELLKLHKELNKSLNKYAKHFGRGGFYQGLESIQITGQRPTEDRFKRYGIKKYMKKNQNVLDIGSNYGFFSLYSSQFVDSVDGIEPDQNFINIANEVKNFLEIKNCNFCKCNFDNLKPKKRYDIIISLAVHAWVKMNFKEYLKKIEQMLNKKGILLLESQDLKIDKHFEKNTGDILGDRFIIEKKGILKDDGIIERKFMILRKKY